MLSALEGACEDLGAHLSVEATMCSASLWISFEESNWDCACVRILTKSGCQRVGFVSWVMLSFGRIWLRSCLLVLRVLLRFMVRLTLRMMLVLMLLVVSLLCRPVVWVVVS